MRGLLWSWYHSRHKEPYHSAGHLSTSQDGYHLVTPATSRFTTRFPGEVLDPMPIDKSLFFYGPIYHRLFDPQLAEGRRLAVDLIREGSSVLDIACGTGQLCIALREQKRCRVTGLDLSLRMLAFARKASTHPDVTFVHGDATDLSAFGDRSFDYATMLFVMHELPMPQQALVLREALRVATRGIIVDAVSPLPWNVGGIGIRLIEATFGHDHNPNFRAFLATGGIWGVARRLINRSTK
jgi:SAM-dependent methyltransferase